MLDIERIRREPEVIRRALGRRGEEEFSLDLILDLDVRRRELVSERDSLRERRNEASKEIGRMKQKPADRIQEMRDVGDRIKAVENEVREVEVQLRDRLLWLPNIPLDDVPDGQGASDNVEVRSHGSIPQFSFTPLPHWDLAENLGILDLERGAKISGSRFFVLKGAGARLQRALISWMLDLHTREHGYKEMVLPYLVRRNVMEGSGNLPKFADNLYHDEEDDLWLIPTAEVPLTNLYRDEILDPGTLPLHLVAHTHCFRREKAAAGKDTRGIKRVHQFDKVEMYKFVEPERSDEELEALVANAEKVCSLLGMPYRVVQLCAGDMGFPSAKSYDLEMWAAGSGEWLEVSSCSNCTDFQARRSNIRFRRDPQARTESPHTLNGSGLAIPRVLIAILENFQREDGSVEVPEVLRPYTGFAVITPKDSL